MNDPAKLVTADGKPFDPAAYEIVLSPLSDDDGGGFFARIPALPGCMGDGETEVDAIADVRAAALEWALACAEYGDPIPAPEISGLQAAE